MSLRIWTCTPALLAAAGAIAFAQPSYFYRSTDATGRLTRTAVVNLSQFASAKAAGKSASILKTALSANPADGPQIQLRVVEPQPRAMQNTFSAKAAIKAMASLGSSSLTVGAASQNTSSFEGLNHTAQRFANQGNQFSVEPPSPAIAVANGFVLEGVNNAIQVYSQAGVPQLSRAVATNELFAVPPAIDRTTGLYGVYPTDMRVFYDRDIDRWFVVQRAQDYNIFGFPQASSHMYVAVSQSGDPRGYWTIYTMDTTNAFRPGCPCFSDFPQIGADQYGIYISSDEYGAYFGSFADVSILAISKAALAAAAASPTMHEFVIPRLTGYEGTVAPAVTPAGAAYVVGGGGVEFFLSTQTYWYSDSSFGLWALMNTASLNTTPDLTLTLTIVPGQTYQYPDEATQKPGPLRYGSTLTPPGKLSYIHGGRDSRVLSLTWAGAKLYATFASQTTDDTGKSVVGSGYVVVTPAIREGVLRGAVTRQGVLSVRNSHLLRPAIAVNAQGNGAIAFTLVGPDYYPSAAFVPVQAGVPGTAVQVATPGAGPEDGFTAYPDFISVFEPVARWGDYNGALVTPDGSVWMIVQYIPEDLRTDLSRDLANWGTRVIRLAQ